jgi:hypothetical protein
VSPSSGLRTASLFKKLFIEFVQSVMEIGNKLDPIIGVAFEDVSSQAEAGFITVVMEAVRPYVSDFWEFVE